MSQESPVSNILCQLCVVTPAGEPRHVARIVNTPDGVLMAIRHCFDDDIQKACFAFLPWVWSYLDEPPPVSLSRGPTPLNIVQVRDAIRDTVKLIVELRMKSLDRFDPSTGIQHVLNYYTFEFEFTKNILMTMRHRVVPFIFDYNSFTVLSTGSQLKTVGAMADRELDDTRKAIASLLKCIHEEDPDDVDIDDILEHLHAAARSSYIIERQQIPLYAINPCGAYTVTVQRSSIKGWSGLAAAVDTIREVTGLNFVVNDLRLVLKPTGVQMASMDAVRKFIRWSVTYLIPTGFYTEHNMYKPMNVAHANSKAMRHITGTAGHTDMSNTWPWMPNGMVSIEHLTVQTVRDAIKRSDTYNDFASIFPQGKHHHRHGLGSVPGVQVVAILYDQWRASVTGTKQRHFVSESGCNLIMPAYSNSVATFYSHISGQGPTPNTTAMHHMKQWITDVFGQNIAGNEAACRILLHPELCMYCLHEILQSHGDDAFLDTLRKSIQLWSNREYMTANKACRTLARTLSVDLTPRAARSRDMHVISKEHEKMMKGIQAGVTITNNNIHTDFIALIRMHLRAGTLPSVWAELRTFFCNTQEKHVYNTMLRCLHLCIYDREDIINQTPAVMVQMRMSPRGKDLHEGFAMIPLSDRAESRNIIAEWENNMTETKLEMMRIMESLGVTCSRVKKELFGTVAVLPREASSALTLYLAMLVMPENSRVRFM